MRRRLPTMQVTLTPEESEVLFRQDPESKNDGGFQAFLVSLQERTDRTSGTLILTDEDLQKIPRYAFKYKDGGWEKRLRAIFQRSLGPNLKR
jgi:hypothetical protein